LLHAPVVTEFKRGIIRECVNAGIGAAKTSV
jgi:hypothetical protein